MSEFKISLAGVIIEIHALHEESRTFCRDYLVEDGEAMMRIVMSEEDIQRERELSKRQNEREGHAVIHYSSRYLETLAIYRKIAEEMIARFDTLLMHGAVVAHNGGAYLFTAKSGTGKTTHIRLWLKHIKDVHVLNGDKPLLKVENGVVYACGTPWQGKENYGRNEILPLKGICILERGEDNTIETISAGTILPTLIQQTYQPSSSALIQKKLMLVMDLAKEVPAYRLKCTLNKEGAQWVSFEAMTGETADENRIDHTDDRHL